jgi:hypothetical protein
VASPWFSVVLAQDRGRFAREPAYLSAYLLYLREEFAQHQTALWALNDRGDESPDPQGKNIWSQFFITGAINDDAYRPHSREEIEKLVAKGQMSPEVASRLDPDKRYGIW